MEITPTAANVKEYVAIVKDKALLRRIAETAGELTALVQEGTGTGQEVLEAAEQRIYAIRQGRAAQGLTHISSVILGVYERLNELAASDQAVPGLSTGLPDVDMAISGLNKSDLILLAARPGMGKTSFALNLLLHAGKFSGKTVVFFSLEMSREQLCMRLISSESFVDNKKLVTGKLGEDDWTKIAAASAALNQTQILIDDNPSLSVADMNAKCRRVDNLGLVVIDYLQLMTSAGGPQRSGDNRQQIVSDISRALKIMAKELNVPVVCLSQLSRGPESRSDKRPMLSDLRESGAIEQDADIVMFLYRDDYYNDDSENHKPRTATARPALWSCSGCRSTRHSPVLTGGTRNTSVQGGILPPWIRKRFPRKPLSIPPSPAHSAGGCPPVAEQAAVCCAGACPAPHRF